MTRKTTTDENEDEDENEDDEDDDDDGVSWRWSIARRSTDVATLRRVVARGSYSPSLRYPPRRPTTPSTHSGTTRKLTNLHPHFWKLPLFSTPTNTAAPAATTSTTPTTVTGRHRHRHPCTKDEGRRDSTLSRGGAFLLHWDSFSFRITFFPKGEPVSLSDLLLTDLTN